MCQSLSLSLSLPLSLSLSVTVGLVCDLRSYNDEGIWKWNTHDSDWIYQGGACPPSTLHTALAAPQQLRADALASHARPRAGLRARQQAAGSGTGATGVCTQRSRTWRGAG